MAIKLFVPKIGVFLIMPLYLAVIFVKRVSHRENLRRMGWGRCRTTGQVQNNGAGAEQKGRHPQGGCFFRVFETDGLQIFIVNA